MELAFDDAETDHRLVNFAERLVEPAIGLGLADSTDID
jgi:hypothetical protein